MSNAKIKTRAEEAFDELSVLLQEKRFDIDEFTQIRLEKAARSGIEIFPSEAHQVLAILAGLRWDAAAMDENFSTAMRFGTESIVEHNYAETLRAANRYVDAANMYERASNTNPTDLVLLRSAMVCNWQAGRWQRAMDLAEILMQRSPDEEFEYLAKQRALIEMAQRNGVSLGVVEQLHTALYSFLRDRHIRALSSATDMDHTPGEESIYIAIRIKADREEVQRLDEELTPVLFDAVEVLPLGSFHIYLDVEEEDDRGS